MKRMDDNEREIDDKLDVVIDQLKGINSNAEDIGSAIQQQNVALKATIDKAE